MEKVGCAWTLLIAWHIAQFLYTSHEVNWFCRQLVKSSVEW